MTKDELIAALEAATGPSRPLDDEIAQCVGALGFGAFSIAERYTASIDAALTLVPTDWCWEIRCAPKEYPIGAGIAPVAPVDEWTCSDTGGQDATGATAAIALCIAALRARP